MKRHLRQLALFLALAILLAACVSVAGSNANQPSSNQVATSVAMTLQALAPKPQNTSAGVPNSSTNLLPHNLYFLSSDNQAITQLYRLERDGRSKTQLTSETESVTDYDVSPVDGSLAYVVGNQFVLSNADGSNRRVLVEGGNSPVFSPDGQTLAYARNGLNLYSLSTGTSNLAIKDQMSDAGNGQLLPVETYSPERYSPDGTKLLVALGHWEMAPSHAVYYPGTNALVRYEEVKDYIYCCSFHGGPAWSPDSSSFFGVASAHDFAYQSGELWKVDAASGAVTRMLKASEGTLSLPKEVFPAPDGQLYFFLGTYNTVSGFYDAPVLQLVRSAPDGVTNRTVLSNENFMLMNEALWAPDASFVLVTTAPARNWDQPGGVLQLYYTSGQHNALWLAPSAWRLKWGL